MTVERMYAVAMPSPSRDKMEKPMKTLSEELSLASPNRSNERARSKCTTMTELSLPNHLVRVLERQSAAQYPMLMELIRLRNLPEYKSRVERSKASSFDFKREDGSNGGEDHVGSK